MKKNEIKVGGHYRAKVNGNLVTVRVDAINETEAYGRYNTRTAARTSYHVTNLATKRRTVFHSAAKFRIEVKPVEGFADGKDVVGVNITLPPGYPSRRSEVNPKEDGDVENARRAGELNYQEYDRLAEEDRKARTPDAELDPSELENQPEEVERNRLREIADETFDRR